MKRVSLEVAKVIKKAGYPQDDCDEYLNNHGAIDSYLGHNIARPTYLETWMWLEKEKRIIIQPDSSFTESGELKYSTSTHFINSGSIGQDYIYNSSEEAIIAAIDYLVENDLIK